MCIRDRLIGYLTGAILLVAGAAILQGEKVRVAATYLGSWIFLLVLFVYGPILIASLLDPSTDVKVEGLNYFFDTLLYAGTILALANATPRPIVGWDDTKLYVALWWKVSLRLVRRFFHPRQHLV